jgi:hypothetical protein
MVRAAPVAAALLCALSATAQETYFDRLATDELAVMSPTERVSGGPGNMRVVENACHRAQDASIRRRIVDIAVQEWGFFGFKVVDQTIVVENEPRPPRPREYRRRSWLNAEESARVADSIAGYWSITGDGRWILDRQNTIWSGPTGVASRWRDPWSAAFISWVMCEAGLGDKDQFDRAIAHHAYIDQAIQARDDDTSAAAFVAFDVGETRIEPGDLLCSARRPRYDSIEERRGQLGSGIRSHCDIVIQLDPGNDRILVIGGNVRGSVSLKLLPAIFGSGGNSEACVQSVGSGRRAVFAHLKLRADSIEENALETSATMRALAASGEIFKTVQSRLANR